MNEMVGGDSRECRISIFRVVVASIADPGGEQVLRGTGRVPGEHQQRRLMTGHARRTPFFQQPFLRGTRSSSHGRKNKKFRGFRQYGIFCFCTTKKKKRVLARHRGMNNEMYTVFGSFLR